MKIIFSIFLTLALVSCGEIRLELGGNDVGEVGTYAWIPQPDKVVSPQDGLIRRGGYLVNTRTGVVQECLKYNPDSDLFCIYAADPTNITAEDF